MVLLCAALILSLSPIIAFARSEAVFIEGVYGKSDVSMRNLNGDPIKPKKNTSSILRFHIPVYQDSVQILSTTLSNEYFDSEDNQTGSTSQSFLTHTSLGFGVSYRLSILFFGAEYQSGTYRMLTTGTNTNSKSFTHAQPTFYGGLLYRFGGLGIGLVHTLNESKITPRQMGNSTGSTFIESGTLLTITLHFDGDKRTFFKNLFRRGF